MAPDPLVPDVSTPSNSTTDHEQFACTCPPKSMVSAPVDGAAPIARNSVSRRAVVEFAPVETCTHVSPQPVSVGTAAELARLCTKQRISRFAVGVMDAVAYED